MAEPGVLAPFKHGSPGTGGFGLLPMVPHIMAHNGKTAAYLARTLLQLEADGPPPRALPPWVCLAHYLLQQACPALPPTHTLLLATFSTAENAALGVLGTPGVDQRRRIPAGTLTRAAQAMQAAGPLLRSPEEQSEQGCPTQLLAGGAASPDQLRSLAWRGPKGDMHPVRHDITVRALTAHYTTDLAAQRHSRQLDFVSRAAAAAGHGAAAVAAGAKALRRRLYKAWRLPVSGQLKEPLWRLAAGATPGARNPAWQCPCDLAAAPPHDPDAHTFWQCPVAEAVRDQLRAGLAHLGAAAPPALPRQCLWLMEPPPAPGLDEEVWMVVCIAAVHAMDQGRRTLWKRRRGPDWPDPGPQGVAALYAASALPTDLLEDYIMPSLRRDTDAIMAEITVAAAACFWETLWDIAATAPARAAFRTLGPNHPFLYRDEQQHVGGGGGSTLRVRLPGWEGGEGGG